ncbi:MAG: hypothetical protein ACKVOP_00945 [Sphingomonadaceae bacterium]
MIRILKASALLAIASLTALNVGSVHAAVIEDFESGRFQAPWNDAGDGGFPGTPIPLFGASGAHDGAIGVSDGGGNWQYRTDPAAALGSGSTLSVWFRTTGEKFGSLILGFGADSTGASSLYIHTYFNTIAFQNNDFYVNFTETVSRSFTFDADKW